jgi:putative peptidoglycan lipid II flippase
VTGAIYQGGAFGQADTVYVWSVLAGAGVGLLASTQGRLYASAFYALKDTRTPLRFAIVRVVLTAVLGYAAAFLLPPMLGIASKWGVAGLTASAGVSGWVEFLLLSRRLEKTVGRIPAGAATIARFWGAAIAAAAVAWAVRLHVPSMGPLFLAVAVLGPYGVVYLLLAGPRRLRAMIGGREA